MISGSRYRYRERAEWSNKFEEMFKWLEKQNPPIIVAPTKRDGAGYVVYGPNNNMDKVFEKLLKSRQCADTLSKREGSIATRKGQVRYLDAKLLRYPPVKYGPISINVAVTREPKYIDGPIHYVYNIPDTSLDKLTESVNCLVCLGRGIDLAFGRLRVLHSFEEVSSDGLVYRPVSRGQAVGDVEDTGSGFRSSVLLDTPVDGWFERLEENYAEWRKPPQRGFEARRGTVPPALTRTLYSINARVNYMLFSLESPDGQPFSYPIEEGMKVAAWTRHAVASALKDKFDPQTIRSYVYGHGDSAQREDRLSYVPLPSIGSVHSDGRIRRVMIAQLQGSTDNRARAVEDVLETADIILRREEYDGNGSSRNDGVPVARLVHVDDFESDRVVQYYTGVSKTWSTVTPVLLHGHDMRNGKLVPGRKDKLVNEAFSQAGYSEMVEEIELTKSSLIGGLPYAQEFNTPSHLRSWPRYHAFVCFREPMHGPLVIGIGRHYGIGLFARQAV
jgi:CRISPR-associated protein Csb2